jgi:hypothetical protein
MRDRRALDGVGCRLLLMDPASIGRLYRLRQLRESFGEWHRLALAATTRGDVASTRDAIHSQAEILRELDSLVREWRAAGLNTVRIDPSSKPL